ncbi:MAG TPA: 2-amino-3,7-dideoxy-D-threo-hept-6-ulosonate synthase [Candidatus Thermoplasmatota archaeon]|nr:2-amino-3,7-dideoxy-D-threo-hept-6-ulosonate synthase [Candidatus Thermoplasmatota archaeon]
MAANPIRLRRIARADGTCLMVPLDHGISMGPAQGLADPRLPLAIAAKGGATCVTLHKGLVPLAAPFADRLGILLHLSASTDGSHDPHDKRLVATVQEAARMGCDGVSIHVNVGSLTEACQLEDAGKVSTACNELGMPLVAMMYPRGPGVKDPFDPALVAHAARLGAELGADLVKVPYSGPGFRDAVQGCPVPVLVAGGPRRDSFGALVADLREARHAGAKGLSVGRNVFQQADPAQALADLVALFADPARPPPLRPMP